MAPQNSNDHKTLSDVPVEEETPKPLVPTAPKKNKLPLDERVLDSKTPPLITKWGFIGVLLLATLIAISLGVVTTLRERGDVAGINTSPQADLIESERINGR